MHEMSLAEGVLQIVEEKALEGGFGQVSVIHLEVGQLANVEIEALRFALDAVLAGTLADGAAVEITEVAGLGRCSDCRATVAVAARYEACPVCGGYRLDIVDGAQMRVREIGVLPG